MFRAAFSCLCLSWLATNVASQTIQSQTQAPSAQSINGVSFPSLIEVTVEDLQIGMEQGLFTAVDLVSTYIQRINQMNSTLHMVTEINPDALSIAASLDAQRAAGNILGPLHGVPILIKNNIATNDKMNNTAGSFALLGSKVPSDSTIASKLRAAGAIILGKTNLSQWANYRSFNTSNGWSAYGGQTKAAYVPNQDPSGSSSGSGVSSSIGLALAALGTETSGSILSPSNNNNLVGIKPSVGLTSRYLVIPISEHQDTIGPMARTVKDAAYILQAIAGKDAKGDNYTTAIPNKGVLPDYVAACNFSALRGARIGIPANVLAPYYVTPRYFPLMDAFNSMVAILKEAGATIVVSNFTGLAEYRASGNSSIVLGADFKTNLKEYLDKLTYNPNKITSEESLRTFTETFPGEQFSPTSRDVGVWNNSLALGFGNKSPQLWQAYQFNQYLGGEATLLGAISRNNLDAVIMPTPFSPGFAAITGSPVVTVPMGFYPANTTVTMNAFGLATAGPNFPFGLSFMGARFTEAKLIGLAYAYEQRTMVRNKVQPYIVPNIELPATVAARLKKRTM